MADVRVYCDGALINNCVSYSVEDGWAIYEDYAVVRIVDGYNIIHKTKIKGTITLEPV